MILESMGVLFSLLLSVLAGAAVVAWLAPGLWRDARSVGLGLLVSLLLGWWLTGVLYFVVVCWTPMLHGVIWAIEMLLIAGGWYVLGRTRGISVREGFGRLANALQPEADRASPDRQQCARAVRRFHLILWILVMSNQFGENIPLRITYPRMYWHVWPALVLATAMLAVRPRWQESAEQPPGSEWPKINV